MQNIDRYRVMLDNLYEGVYFVDCERRITFWNQGAARLTGYSAEEMTGRFCHDNLLNHVDESGNELCLNGCPLSDSIRNGVMRESAVYLRHKSGHRVPVLVRTVPIREGGRIIGAVESFTDNSEHRAIAQSLEEFKSHAYNDPLTTLPNRRYTEHFLASRMSEYRTLGIPFGIAFIDIDHFKGINDTYGHNVGDEVLRTVSRTFLGAVRSTDTVGRWGGEEFLAVLPGVTEDILAVVSERIRMLVERAVTRTGERDIMVTVSIGATTAREGESTEEMLHRADTLLYQSKRNGRNLVSLV